MNSQLLLAGRILLAIIFVTAGFGKLIGAAGFSGYLGSLGFPAPLAMAYLVGLFELLAGLAILAGYKTTLAAYALAAFCVATGLLAHAGEMSALTKNLALAGGFLVLAAAGPGRHSIDARTGTRSSHF